MDEIRDERVFRDRSGGVFGAGRTMLSNGSFTEGHGTRKTPVAPENSGSAMTGLARPPDDRRLAVGCEEGGVSGSDAPSVKL